MKSKNIIKMDERTDSIATGSLYSVSPLDLIVLFSFVGLLLWWFFKKKEEPKPVLNGLAGLKQISSTKNVAASDSNSFLEKMNIADDPKEPPDISSSMKLHVSDDPKEPPDISSSMELHVSGKQMSKNDLIVNNNFSSSHIGNVKVVHDNSVQNNYYSSTEKRILASSGCIASFTVIFLILLGVFLWQYYVPGTRLRYLICEAGRKKPHGTASFKFIPLDKIHIFPKVNGIEYEYEKLLKNMHMEEYQPIADHYNQTGFRYYKNVDLCAYGKLTDTEDVITGAKRVRGPQIFAVDEKCYFAYYYSEGIKRWQKYNSVSWPERQNIWCDPPNIMKYKEVIEGDPSDSTISNVAKT